MLCFACENTLIVCKNLLYKQPLFIKNNIRKCTLGHPCLMPCKNHPPSSLSVALKGRAPQASRTLVVRTFCPLSIFLTKSAIWIDPSGLFTASNKEQSYFPLATRPLRPGTSLFLWSHTVLIARKILSHDQVLTRYVIGSWNEK